MSEKNATEWYDYRRQAIQAAKDLGYSDSVINRIKHAKTDNEITQIMASARNADCDYIKLEPRRKHRRKIF